MSTPAWKPTEGAPATYKGRTVRVLSISECGRYARVLVSRSWCVTESLAIYTCDLFPPPTP